MLGSSLAARLTPRPMPSLLQAHVGVLRVGAGAGATGKLELLATNDRWGDVLPTRGNLWGICVICGLVGARSRGKASLWPVGPSVDDGLSSGKLETFAAVSI